MLRFRLEINNLCASRCPRSEVTRTVFSRHATRMTTWRNDDEANGRREDGTTLLSRWTRFFHAREGVCMAICAVTGVASTWCVPQATTMDIRYPRKRFYTLRISICVLDPIPLNNMYRRDVTWVRRSLYLANDTSYLAVSDVELFSARLAIPCSHGENVKKSTTVLGE